MTAHSNLPFQNGLRVVHRVRGHVVRPRPRAQQLRAARVIPADAVEVPNVVVEVMRSLFPMETTIYVVIVLQMARGTQNPLPVAVVLANRSSQSFVSEAEDV